MLKNWFKIFVNHSVKNKVFTFLTVLGLAIGIAGLILATLYYKNEGSYDQWNQGKNEIYEVLSVLPDGETWGYSQASLAKNIKIKTNKLQDYCYYTPFYMSESVTVNGKNQYCDKILIAQTNFFEFFPFQFVNGNKELFKNNKNSIALEEGEALRIFGNQNPINQIITLNKQKLLVTGVYRLSEPSSLMPKYVISIDVNGFNEDNNEWGNYNYCLMLKLKSNNDVSEIERVGEQVLTTNKLVPSAKEKGVSLEKFIEENGKFSIKLQSLNNVRLGKNTTGFLEGKGNRLYLQINMGLAALILVLSVINYINLSTAEAMRRAKEVGVRKVLGASKQNIIYQFVFETAIITVFAMLLALCLTELTLPFYNNLINKTLSIGLVDFWLYLLVIFIIVVLLAGFFPAVYIANFETLKVLKGNFSRSRNGIWIRNCMLVLQFAIATFFIVSGLIVTSQVNHLAAKDLGFKTDQILSFKYSRYDVNSYKFYEAFKQDLLKIPGVVDVNVSTADLGYGSGSTSGFSLNNSKFSTQAHNIAFDFGYFKMFGMEILEGRDLSANIASDTIENVLLNERAVSDLGGKVPLGTIFDWNGQKMNVVGIVKNFNLTSPQEKVPPMLFMHMNTVNWMQSNINNIQVKIKPENADKTIAALEVFWKAKINPNVPFEYEFINKKFQRSYDTYTKQQTMFKILNILVVVIALFGLYALSSFSMERRYKEIAIRKVLGGDTPILLKILTRQYIYLALIGFIMAVVPSYVLMQKWLENFAYRIEISVIPYLVAFVLLFVLTLLVVLSKAFSATRINLLRFLKYE